MNLVKNLICFIIVSGIIFLPSCNKQEYSYLQGKKIDSIPDRVQFSNSSCSFSSLVKSKVDILFLFDNSTSSFFLNKEDRNTITDALLSTINEANQRFNYRVMVAPLISNSLTSGIAVAAQDVKDITPAGKSLTVGAGSELTDRASSINSNRGLKRIWV